VRRANCFRQCQIYDGTIEGSQIRGLANDVPVLNTQCLTAALGEVNHAETIRQEGRRRSPPVSRRLPSGKVRNPNAEPEIGQGGYTPSDQGRRRQLILLEPRTGLGLFDDRPAWSKIVSLEAVGLASCGTGRESLDSTEARRRDGLRATHQAAGKRDDDAAIGFATFCLTFIAAAVADFVDKGRASSK